MASNRRVWVTLVDGKGDQLMSPGKVSVSPDSDVDDLKQAVKAMYHDSILERIPPPALSVYADQAAFARNDAPLAADARVEGYGEHLANAILVVAPFTSNKRQRGDDVETQGALESPVSVLSNKAWQAFVSTAKPTLSDSNFFHALCTAPINPVDRIEDLPIAEPVPGCITTFTDPITQVQVVCLPHRLPRSTLIFSHVVFIRPFTVAMVKAMTTCMEPRIAVVGNTGIGKSFMQLVILLWWARPELRPVPENVDDGAALDKFLDGIQAIARVERGSCTDLFFKREQLHYVVDKVHQTLLDRLDSTSTLLLYEPCVSKDEIEICGIADGHVWATVSPLEQRYKEFSKTRAAVKYMECPYEDELVFMAAVMVIGVEPELKPLYEESLVRERIRTRGPFLRVVLPESVGVLKAEGKVGRSELSELTLEKLQNTWFITEERSVGMMEISDRILRISPELDGVFESYTLKPANDLVTERLGNLMFDVDVRELKRQLIAYVEALGHSTA
ncbi:hypothetical protein H257_18815 [Aphanomyces astaci]|uniref:Uncharacterized protein n=1 Tax=Aphanomyces astaci TaxID=112090 RepID=W4FBH5_APHAT|nr:hypothetical protein H257_18815 [Aphanomyces astaci]ETV64269.1 hypothetical protein H257_18815 [Aphanomyces astaci]|eukprot:XP_009846243.1 hypothetical protein H257_18815 [Aphanomyces astaci]